MFVRNRTLFVIAVIAVVNALGYGIIIPLLYGYSKKFGLTDFENGLLFSTFSLFQLIATPIIGRLSDAYGRRPLLLISLAGTAVSFLTMAFAPSALFLFIARALDGITAGNIPVASAVISDTTDAKNRARGFGIIGASFGFGFVFGPAIAALTVGFGQSVPFLIAAAVTLIAIVLTFLFLPETNTHKKVSIQRHIIDVKLLVRMLYDKNIGKTLQISLLYALAFSVFIYAYQPFSVNLLHLSPQEISVNFTLFGVVGLISQGFLIGLVAKKFGETKTMMYALFAAIGTFLAFFLTRNYLVFTVISLFHAFANGFINPMLQSLLSKEVDHTEQGMIMGLNASYMSIGMIFGPIIGGLLATLFIPLPFLFGAMLVALCTYLAVHVHIKGQKKGELT